MHTLAVLSAHLSRRHNSQNLNTIFKIIISRRHQLLKCQLTSNTSWRIHKHNKHMHYTRGFFSYTFSCNTHIYIQATDTQLQQPQHNM